jgi:hypothetical protein
MDENKLSYFLDTFDFAAAEKVISETLEDGAIPSDQTLFVKAISAFGQYSFGSTRVKEVAAYLLKIDSGIETTPQHETLLKYCSERALNELKTFHTEMGNSVRQASVGTITDPTFKMITDNAVIAGKMEERASHILDVLRILQDFEAILGKKGMLVNDYADFAARQGTDLGKSVNNTLRSKGYAEKSTSSCYVATAVYGRGDHPKVELLRNFRDQYLISQIWGKLMVSAYYHVGPYLARRVVKRFWSYRISRRIIDNIVTAINAKSGSHNG